MGSAVERMATPSLPPNERLRRASARGDISNVKEALNDGAAINATGGYNRTALHFAIAKEPENVDAVVQILFASNASVHVRDKGGSCPIHLAAENGLKGVVGQLIAAGADVDSRDDVYGRTALHWASESGNEGVVLTLLEAGASPDVNDSVKDGNTPLDVAKTTRIANILLDALAKPGAPQQSAAVHDAENKVAERQQKEDSRKAELEKMRSELEAKRSAMEQKKLEEAALAADEHAPPPAPQEAIVPRVESQDKLAARLKSLGEVFAKSQSQEAERYKVLKVLLVRLRDDMCSEKMVVEDRFNWFSREVKLLQNHMALDINVLKQTRCEMDKVMTRQIDEKCGVLRSDLVHERELREEGERRTILPPNTLPSLADKVDLAGDVRYDRGEQLMKKINSSIGDLQEQLTVEVNCHKEITDFMANIESKCRTLRAELEEEKRFRQQAEDRHGQRMEALRTLPPLIEEDANNRVDRRSKMQERVNDEMKKMLQYVQAEQTARADGESSLGKMLNSVTDKLNDEIRSERSLREASEEKFFLLLQDTCDRARDRVEAIAHWKP